MSDPICNWCEQPGCPGDVRCVRDGRMLPGHLSKLDERLAGIVSRHAGALAALAKGPQADVPAEQIAAEWEVSARTMRDEMSALTSRLAAVEAERDEARGLLGECLDGEWIECVNEPECDDEHEPLDDRHWCQRCQMRLRVAAHLGRSE